VDGLVKGGAVDASGLGGVVVGSVLAKWQPAMVSTASSKIHAMYFFIKVTSYYFLYIISKNNCIFVYFL
jgi:hypothetical protein